MYQCPRCHYETFHKGNLLNHFNKKKPCAPIYSTITQRVLKQEIKQKNAFKLQEETNNNEMLETKNSQVKTQILQENTQNNNENNVSKYECKYCHKLLSRKDNLNRHLKSCKTKKELENSKDEQIRLLQEEILRLKDKKCNNKITNNYYTNNTQNNNIQQNIKINAFREENIDYLTPEYILAIAKRGMYYAIPKLIEKIYFNENHPENQNVKITNEKSKYGEIFDGKRFVKCAKNLIVKDMICVSIDIIDEVCCNVDMPIPYDQFSKKYNDRDRELMNSLYKKAEGIALTYSRSVCF